MAAACPAATSQRAFSGSISAGALAGVFHREHARHRHLGEARVGHVAVQVGVGQLLRLDLDVQFLRRRAARKSASGNCDMMFSISSAAMPWPLGGSS